MELATFWVIFFTNSSVHPGPDSLKNELRRSFTYIYKFELSWVAQLLKHFYILCKLASLGRAAQYLNNFLKYAPASQPSS
jgi:hypothetical protein